MEAEADCRRPSWRLRNSFLLVDFSLLKLALYIKIKTLFLMSKITTDNPQHEGSRTFLNSEYKQCLVDTALQSACQCPMCLRSQIRLGAGVLKCPIILHLLPQPTDHAHSNCFAATITFSIVSLCSPRC